MRVLLRAIEFVLFFAALVFAIAWVLSPERQWEPYITLLTLMGAFLADGRRRKHQKAESKPAQKIERKIQEEVQAHVAKNAPQQSLHPSESASFFAQRFSQAFPGVRSIQWYSGQEAIKHLEILLQEPLVFKNGEGTTTPIWWWRDGNLQIPSFKRLSEDVVLLDTKELKITRIAAVPSQSYFRCFVYLESAPMAPCGAYEWTEKKKEELRRDHGYAWEEYGLYKGKHVVTRAEYDDNAAKIIGKIVRLGGDVELRERYITPFNLVVAPHLSPINNPSFDATLRSFMDRMLRGHATIEELAEHVRQLPKREV